MNIEFIEDKDKEMEIKYSLPSMTIMWAPDVILIKHPDKDIHFVLKSRNTNSADDLLKLPMESFENFNERRSWDADHKDLARKRLIFDETILNNRGREVLKSL